MNETTTNANQEIREQGSSILGTLPAGVQVLIDWFIFVISTLVSYFSKKKEG